MWLLGRRRRGGEEEEVVVLFTRERRRQEEAVSAVNTNEDLPNAKHAQHRPKPRVR